MMQKLVMTDFSGGLVDTPYFPDPRCAVKFDNFLIKKNKTIEASHGLSLFTERLPTNKRVSAIVKMGNEYIAFSDGRAYVIDSSGDTEELLGPSGGKAFNLGNHTNLVSTVPYNGHIFATNDARPNLIKIYKDENNDYQIRTAGLPVPAFTPTFSGTGSNNFLYAFAWKYEYMVGNVTYVDISGPMYFQKQSLGTSTTISSLPAFPIGSGDHYDLTKLKLQIYRSTNNGTSLYLVDEVDEGVTSFTDNVSDATIVSNEGLYTNGGLSPNNRPAPCKYLMDASDAYYLLNISEGGTNPKPYRALQSITNDPDSVPSDYIADFKSDIIGGASVGRIPIVLTRDSVVRIEGVIDDAGVGSVGKEVLSSTIGGISHNGIVKCSRGIYFPGTDGFYFTDGYTTPTKLAKKDPHSSKIDDFYRSFTDTEGKRSKIQGVYDSLNNRVYWTVQQMGADNDYLYVYDETHDAFTRITFTNSNISPSSLLVDGDTILIGDSNGYIFKMHADEYSLPVLDVNKDTSLWGSAPIIPSWKPVYLTGGDPSVNKWFTTINMQGMPETNVDIALRSYTNGEDTYKEMYPLKVSPSFTWGDPEFTWGSPSFVWDRVEVMNQTRRFPHGRLRARQRQVEVTTAYVTILNANNALISVDSVNGAITLDPASEVEFGANYDGYDLVIDGTPYPILSSTIDGLMVSPSPASGDYTEWSIMGTPKGQRMHINAMAIEFEMLSSNGTLWHGSSDK